MTKWFRILAVTAVAAASLPAQTSTTNAPTVAEIVANRVARLTKLLTLTTAQVTQATTIFTAEETALATIQTSLTTAHTALTTAVEANDTSGITTQSTQIGALTTQEVHAEATADAAFYLILTADQQTKYKELLAAGLDAVPGHGPGGNGH